MYYLSIDHIVKSYGYHQILNGVSFVVNAGERVGLVGANGVGKSTLLRIISGEVEADSGTITIPAGLQIGYLPQTVTGDDDQTLADLIAESMRHLVELESRMRALEKRMTTSESDELDAVMNEYGEISEQFERYGGYEMDYRTDAVLNGLGVGHIPRQRRFATLSGGEKERVGLALLLLRAPDVLLLDEPTNHLDFASLIWLEDYLQGYRGAVLMVSHDRQFLNRTVNVIVEIDEHSRKARQYSGNYDTYWQTKVQERRKREQDFERQQDEIRTLRHEIKVGAHSNANYRTPTDGDKFIRFAKKSQHDRTVAKRVRAAEERLKRIEANPIPLPPKPLSFNADFNPQALRGRTPLYVSGLRKAFGDRVILDDVTFTLGQDSRVVLVGPNGAGKSTLLRILVGQEVPDSGEVYINPAVTIGYLAQEDDGLPGGATVFEAYRAGLGVTDQQAKATLLHLGLFRYDELDKRVNEISSGQRRKLQIARLIAQGANLLVLDEPTNYVSFDVLEELESALREFPGPVIAASHDRRFMQQFGGDIWEVRGGQIIVHAGGYEGYLAADHEPVRA
ncbi:MAG TPA: ABC-F type ribosomal protection protein [Spirillospora sp.]|nr:ABC-F type ribosomal protection protein [Spirillospora sp.]